MSKKIQLILFTIFAATSLLAQAPNKTGKVNGSVKSSDSKLLESTTIMLLKAKDSSIAKTTFLNKEGDYEFTNVADGKYFVSVNAVGYEKTKTNVIEVNAANPVVKIQSINLIPVSKDLGNVTVTNQKPFIENKLDKMVVNVDASPTNTGLSALEILEKSPGVTLDNDDNISLKGKGGVMILMDGKPAYLSGKDLSNYLRSLPASQLDQIEIMTQPSSKYDATGNSGVINIKTKKNKVSGFNATFTNSAIIANYFKNTSSFNFNWRKNKFNVFGNYSFSYWLGFNDIKILRQYRNSATSDFTTFYNQSSYSRVYDYPNNYKVGVDYYHSKKTTFGVVLSGLSNKTTNTSDGRLDMYDASHNLTQYNLSPTKNVTPWTNFGVNANFRQQLDNKGKEITADADYIFYDTKGTQYSENTLYDPNGNIINQPNNPYLLNGHLPSKIDIFSLKSDYSQPLKNNAKFEAGFKVSYVKTDNDAQYTLYDKTNNNWIADTGKTNHFIYKENINAAYANYSQQIKKFSFQLGLRVEQTIAKGNQLVKQAGQDSAFDRNYAQIFPTVFVSYALNDKHTVTANFGKRINRPSYQDLNPFLYLLDRYTYRKGNPNLVPQFTNAIELGYSYKGQLNITLNYSKTTDIINDVLKTLPGSNGTFITYQVKENIASNQNFGLAVNFSKPLTKWWSLNLFGNLYNNDYKGVINNEDIHENVTAYSFNASNQFKFNKGWSAELSGFYNSQNLVSSTIIASPMGFFSLGAGKQILKNKGSLRLNIRDPFWLMKFQGKVAMDTFTADIQSRWDNRRFILTFTYRFGKPLQQQQQVKKHNSNVDEQNRVSTGGQQ
jgi:outer membrane receptor protein involved in Fe transport